MRSDSFAASYSIKPELTPRERYSGGMRVALRVSYKVLYKKEDRWSALLPVRGVGAGFEPNFIAIRRGERHPDGDA